MRKFRKDKMIYKGVEPISLIVLFVYCISLILKNFNVKLSPEQLSVISTILYGVIKMIRNYQKNK